MTELQVGDQTIRYNREATVAKYQSMERGYAEKCGCVFCRNFAAQRDAIFPASFRALLDQLGIDPNKEGEAFEYGPVEPGVHLYGGWFHFVGEIVVWGEGINTTPDPSPFQFFITTAGPPAPEFRGEPRLSVEFTARVKWLLPESPDSGRRLSTRRPGGPAIG